MDEDYYLNIWLEQVEDKDKVLEILQKLSDEFNMPIQEIVRYIDIVAGYPEASYDLLEKAANLYNSEIVFPKESISSVKKQIKYCKNPMEKKRLEEKLNGLYKEKKNKREW
jgi:hypothetical protein